MNESELNGKITRMIRTEFKMAWCFKCSDRFQSGIPDNIGVMGGRFFAIEVKTERGKLTPIQIHTLTRIESAGGKTCVARSIPEARAFMMSILNQGGYDGTERRIKPWA
jgi:Holliday junction resolvase